MTEINYHNEPNRSDKTLIVRKEQPYNAEPTPADLVKHFVTPEKYFFCRSHGPIPELNEATHRIHVEGLGIKDAPVSFSVQDLKDNFDKKNVMMAMQCAGNRREDLHMVKHTEGVIWGPGAVGNAIYTGCLLKDVLKAAGIDPSMGHNPRLHVAFESVELTEDDEKPYGASVPLSKALDEYGDVLLAYEMNGNPLARDHGYPVRVVIPGYIGARSVKFLQTIRIQDKESNAYHQQLDYKILPEHVENEKEAEKYWSKVPAIGEYNVQSFVCTPPDGMMDDNNGHQAVSCQAEGYALSGGGRSIQRVDVSGDEGKTWVEAQLHTQPFEERDGAYTWSWTLWKATVKAHKGIRIMSRAVDSAGNIQQENPVWNYRGVLSNAWRTMVTPAEKDKR